MNILKIRTLGEFSLSMGDITIRERNARSNKVWALMAYLLQYRGTAFSSQRLIETFWGDGSDSVNPENALRITLHRMRALLDQLWPGAGRELILSQKGSCRWNPEVPLSLDWAEFEDLCTGTADPDRRLDQLLSALALYQGPYLPRQSAELWAVPPATHFSNLFLNASMEAARLLSREDRHPEAVDICRRAAETEPYHEELHCLLMQELAAAGDLRSAAAVYNALSRRLSEEFGILPGEEIRNAYNRLAGTHENRILPMEEVLDHILEPPGQSGAMQCDYEHFKVLCYAKSRSLERTGSVTHVALMHISTQDPGPVMEAFGHTLRTNLRRGDVISRCSGTQYILMLPDADYENSCMVCRRVIAAFRHRYPGTDDRIHYLVQPLTPGIRVP